MYTKFQYFCVNGEEYFLAKLCSIIKYIRTHRQVQNTCGFPLNPPLRSLYDYEKGDLTIYNKQITGEITPKFLN